MSFGIGIYLGRKHALGVRIERVAGKVSMRGWSMEPFAESAPVEVEASLNPSVSFFKPAKPTSESVAIQKVLVKLGLTKAYAGVAISPVHLVTRHFIMPDLPEKEKDEAVRYEASRHTRFKLTESVFGYSENSRVDKAVSITAVAVKKRVVQSAIMHLRRGRVEPLWIEPVYSSFSRAACLFGFSAAAEIPHGLIWFEDDGGVSLTLASKGIVFLSQDFKLPGEPEQDNEKMNDEMQASMRYLYESAGEVRPSVIYIAGFGDLKRWKENLSLLHPEIEIQVIGLSEAWGIPSELEGALVVPLGLALGAAEIKSPLGQANLLPREEKKIPPRQFAIFASASGTAVFLFLLLFQMFVLSPIIRSIEVDKIQVERPLSTFGSLGQQRLDDLAVLQDKLKNQTKVLKGFYDRRLPIYKMINLLTLSLPKEVWLEKLDYSFSANSKREKDSRRADAAADGARLRYTIKLQGNCFIGDVSQESRLVNTWVQQISEIQELKSAFANFSVEELKQIKHMGKTVTRFSILLES